jgi:hypothetical protein
MMQFRWGWRESGIVGKILRVDFEKRRAKKSINQLNLFEERCDICACPMELNNLRATLVNSLAEIQRQIEQLRKRVM